MTLLSIDTNDLAVHAAAAHKDYTAVTTNWNDAGRGVVKGKLSAFGFNITDVRLAVFRDGQPAGIAPCIRPHNLDEKVGVARADRVFVVDAAGDRVSIKDLLANATKYAEYRGIGAIDAKIADNERVVIRYQEAFVALPEGTSAAQVVPVHFSYQTQSPKNPRNLMFCGSAQGVYCHPDTPGANHLYAHQTTAAHTTEHLFTATETAHAVGATHDDEGYTACGRPRAVEMGVEGSGPQGNCFIVVSVPNAQAPRRRLWADAMDDSDDDSPAMPVYRSLGAGPASPGAGVARSARLSVDGASRGVAPRHEGLSITRATRSDGVPEPIVITILHYNTLRARDARDTTVRITADDAKRAVGHMEELYGLCDVSCKLSELPVMLHRLTAEDMARIQETRAKHGDSFAAATQGIPDPFTPRGDAAVVVGAGP